jgi:hypothetical protein
MEPWWGGETRGGRTEGGRDGGEGEVCRENATLQACGVRIMSPLTKKAQDEMVDEE